MTALTKVLDSFRSISATEREKGTYFESLIAAYLQFEPYYSALYSDVWTYSEWAEIQGLDKRDAGIDLVAKTVEGDFHAIQCKLYAADYTLKKADIDSFFTASGKKSFARRTIVSTTNHWSEHAEHALIDQNPPVNKIDLHDLESSQIDWSQFQPSEPPTLKPRKQLRDHQKLAHTRVISGLKAADRGKLIMACGTGKTFTALKIAETLSGAGSRVLVLVPSLALLSQTLTEWTQESEVPLHSFAVCSDSHVGKQKRNEDDLVQTFIHELRYPATTEPTRLALEMTNRHSSTHMSVVFSTYHSIGVISEAQKNCGLDEFDLIICDEAHRTTGATFDKDPESHFVQVHDNSFIQGKKRLYMTATPRIYADNAKATAERDNVAICSMDDKALFGEDLHVLTFSQAVKRGLLVDYKVIVLAVEETHVNRRLQALLADEDNQLRVDDAAKIIGCWKALSKQGLEVHLPGDEAPMQRAVAFCQVIERVKGAKNHKVSSKHIASMFQAVVDEYVRTADSEEVVTLTCEASHVDGSMNASGKEAKLDWLRAQPSPGECRVLSNVRCLSEGVDVPALDAVLFLTPRNSQVDVIQSVGRVMRNAPGKTRGYVVLPVVIPAGVEPHEALNDNKTYRVVWQVLQALRSHDDRFDAMINTLDLIGKDPTKMEIIAVTDKIQRRQRPSQGPTGKGGKLIGGTGQPAPLPVQETLEFEIGEIERAMYAKLVEKVGNRHHWEDWANDIAKIANTHIDRITSIVENPSNTKERNVFDAFAHELRDDLNDSITDAEVIEMLAQHLITKPVFDALFEGDSFAKNNPMSLAMQGVLDVLQEHHLNKEAETLQAFYDSVKMRAQGIDNAAGKQKIVVELYDKFFRNAFPRMTARLGIVYTPVEVVDFIIHSVNHILQTEFGQTLGSKGVHIIDPFTGTGTFVTRLLQSGLITHEQMPYKYQHEIHANEIVLLAYYIAAINIEAVYHSIIGGNYRPFEGICLADTFQLYEKEDLVDAMLQNNSARRKRQKQLDIRVIMANPPYSAGQESANDNNQNVGYPHLDEHIRSTYAERSNATNKNALYDSYIRAIRWASDRIGNSGVIGFVTNAGFLESNSSDGLRKSLSEEFSSIYIFHLRGNQRTSGERSRKEGGKIFGSGSRAPIAISLLVKNPNAKQNGQIHFHDIGDYLSCEEKLEKIDTFASIAGITKADGWQLILPDQHGDWINQRDDGFEEYISLGDKKSKTNTVVFGSYSMGIKTNRDAWVYRYSKNELTETMRGMIAFFNEESLRYKQTCANETAGKIAVEDFINSDQKKISWSRALRADIERSRLRDFRENTLTIGLYRPFCKQHLYFDRHFINDVALMPKFFPDKSVQNRLICVTGRGSTLDFCAFITDTLPDLEMVSKGQCFPLYLYDEPETDDTEAHNIEMFAAPETTKPGRQRRDAITDGGLTHFRTAYPGEQISNEDVFYYIYGLLHSPNYRERFADNLSKELPRIPCVSSASDFWKFSSAGRKLAELHLNYESIEMYPLHVETNNRKLSDADYRVGKMKYGKLGTNRDLSTLIYNEKITLSGIPLEAYSYIVNGKPALDWVVERQCVKTDKNSGIVNDANDWALDTMNNPRYPLELFQRVVTVSLETMKIVNGLPTLSL